MATSNPFAIEIAAVNSATQSLAATLPSLTPGMTPSGTPEAFRALLTSAAFLDSKISPDLSRFPFSLQTPDLMLAGLSGSPMNFLLTPSLVSGAFLQTPAQASLSSQVCQAQSSLQVQDALPSGPASGGILEQNPFAKSFQLNLKPSASATADGFKFPGGVQQDRTKDSAGPKDSAGGPIRSKRRESTSTSSSPGPSTKTSPGSTKAKSSVSGVSQPDLHRRTLNRQAAARCRQRKVDRIASLTTELTALKEAQRTLFLELTVTEKELFGMQLAAKEHVRAGCQLQVSISL